ncbi:hypothetical protein [Endozoicomonas sp. Mp262]|uniref:hypothetical protein n=1 Tax=Endozoicomonas sp. Mp262 TaxID=2919499 RepID=UPI0021DA0127
MIKQHRQLFERGRAGYLFLLLFCTVIFFAVRQAYAGKNYPWGSEVETKVLWKSRVDCTESRAFAMEKLREKPRILLFKNSGIEDNASSKEQPQVAELQYISSTKDRSFWNRRGSGMFQYVGADNTLYLLYMDNSKAFKRAYESDAIAKACQCKITACEKLQGIPPEINWDHVV